MLGRKSFLRRKQLDVVVVVVVVAVAVVVEIFTTSLDSECSYEHSWLNGQ